MFAKKNIIYWNKIKLIETKHNIKLKWKTWVLERDKSWNPFLSIYEEFDKMWYMKHKLKKGDCIEYHSGETHQF